MHSKEGKKSHYGICRIDNDTNRTHGWLVTIQRRGKIYRKLFSDKKCGGRKAAFAAAKCHRDHLTARNRPMSLKAYVEIQRANNTSGVPGVCRYVASETKMLPPDEQRWYWVASWPRPDGSRGRAKFSVNKNGERRAYRMAVAARKEGLRQVRGLFAPRSSS